MLHHKVEKHVEGCGVPWPFVLVMVGLYTATHFGSGIRVTGEVERWLGRPPISMQQYVTDYGDAWRRDELAN